MLWLWPISVRSRGFFATRTPCGMQAAPSPVPQDRSLMRPGCYPESLRSSRWFRVRVFHTLTLAYMSNSLVRVSRRDGWNLADRYPPHLAFGLVDPVRAHPQERTDCARSRFYPRTATTPPSPRAHAYIASRPFSFTSPEGGWEKVHRITSVRETTQPTPSACSPSCSTPLLGCRWQPDTREASYPSNWYRLDDLTEVRAGEVRVAPDPPPLYPHKWRDPLPDRRSTQVAIASLPATSSSFDSLFRVLCIFPSRYLCAIGLPPCI